MTHQAPPHGNPRDGLKGGASPPAAHSPVCQYIDDTTDALIEELDWIITRRFAGQRSIRIESCPDGRWCAMTSEDRIVFPPCPHLDTVERFVRAFAEKERVRVEEESVSVAWSYVQVLNGFSVRADNVVPIRAEA